MRWSIRNQILLPIVTIQAVAVAAIALTTATLSARRSQEQIVDRLNGVVEALARSSFPFTAAVLERMHGLSGAHYFAYDAAGAPVASSMGALTGRAPDLAGVPRAARVATLEGLPVLRLGAERYVAVALRSTVAPSGPTLLILYSEDSLISARREAAWPPLALGAAALGVMVAVTSWIAHRISARIGRVEQQVARIAENDFQELEPGSPPDEIHDLARSVNRMAADLQRMRQEIRQTVQTRLLAQLAAGLAHQLRNSLTGARMSIQLHARRCPLAAGDTSLSVALRQLELTEDQVKGILTLGRLEPAPHVGCDLNRLLAEVATLVELAGRHAGVTLHVIETKRPIEIQADPSGLRAAVLNLALNAIEAAGHGGSVWLQAREPDGRIVLEVRDTGPGPPPDIAEQDKLFDAFATSKPEGVGLGLALARFVAEDHGGSLVWERVGDETRFIIEIPADDPPSI